MNCGGRKHIEILPSKANLSKLFANMIASTLLCIISLPILPALYVSNLEALAVKYCFLSAQAIVQIINDRVHCTAHDLPSQMSQAVHTSDSAPL